jgi:hypothetical protein
MPLRLFGLERHQFRVQVAGPATFRNVARDVAVDALGATLGTGLGRDFCLKHVVTLAAYPPTHLSFLLAVSTPILDEWVLVGNGLHSDLDRGPLARAEGGSD